MKIMPVVSLINMLLFSILLALPIHAEAATPGSLGVAYRGHVQDCGDLPARQRRYWGWRTFGHHRRKQTD